MLIISPPWIEISHFESLWFILGGSPYSSTWGTVRSHDLTIYPGAPAWSPWSLDRCRYRRPPNWGTVFAAFIAWKLSISSVSMCFSFKLSEAPEDEVLWSHRSCRNLFQTESQTRKSTLPETNTAPKNGWLEYYFPIGFRPIFRCELLVSRKSIPSIFSRKETFLAHVVAKSVGVELAP